VLSTNEKVEPVNVAKEVLKSFLNCSASVIVSRMCNLDL